MARPNQKENQGQGISAWCSSQKPASWDTEVDKNIENKSKKSHHHADSYSRIFSRDLTVIWKRETKLTYMK